MFGTYIAYTARMSRSVDAPPADAYRTARVAPSLSQAKPENRAATQLTAPASSMIH